MNYRKEGWNPMRIISALLLFVATVSFLVACTADPDPIPTNATIDPPQATQTVEAPAPDADAIFIDILNNADVPYTSKETAVAVGRAICQQLETAETFMVFAAIQEKYPNLTDEQHMVLLGASEKAYCR